jgi:NADH-quinone oxidoreductase subunit C
MSDRLVQLAANLEKVLGQRIQSVEVALGEVTVTVKADTYFESALPRLS